MLQRYTRSMAELHEVTEQLANSLRQTFRGAIEVNG